MQTKNNSIYEYISNFPENIQNILTEIRTIIQEIAPDATEKISYGIPTFYLNGNLVHFAAYKNHIGFYPGASGIEKFQKEISIYKNSKGTNRGWQNTVINKTFIEELNSRKVSLFIKNYNLETLYEDKSINGLTMFLVQILASVAAMEAETTRARFQSGYRNYVNNGGKVGRKPGHTISDDDLLKKYSEVVKLLKRGLSIRQISKLTENTSTTTILKVKATMTRFRKIS